MRPCWTRGFPACSLLIFMVMSSVAAADPGEALDAIERSLPVSGVMHLRYEGKDISGVLELWVDFTSKSVLQLARTRVHLRDEEGQYSRGTGASPQTGASLGWDPDEPYFARTVLSLPHPVSQAVILLAERARISRVEDSANGWVITWEAPDSKLLRWTDDGEIEVDCKTELRFEIDRSGRIESIQQIQSLPERKAGRITRHDYAEAVQLNGMLMLIPKYIDPRGDGRRPPEEAIWELQSAELLQTAPGPIFTRQGAIALAAAAAQPLVEQFRKSYYWHGSPDAAEQEAMPMLDSKKNRLQPSWSVAFIGGGASVLLIGALAWWRSRR